MQVDYSNSIEMSTVDWSEHVSHTIFLNGCNLRCPYCYNGEVVNRSNMVTIQQLYDEISAAAKYVDSIVFSGGEPMMQWWQVMRMIQHAQSAGLKVGIHTNGMHPFNMQSIMNFVDVDCWMVDFKGNPYNAPSYMRSTGRDDVPMDTINHTLGVLANYSGELEIRTTIVRGLNDSPSDIFAMASTLREWLGADVKYVLQQGITDEAMDSTLHDVRKLTREEMFKLTTCAAHKLNNVYMSTVAHGEERSMNLR